MPKILLLFSLLCLFAKSFAGDYLTEKPDYIDSCKMSDPALPKCLAASAQKLIRQIGEKGLPGLPSMPPQDPALVDVLEIKDPANNSPVRLNAKFTNVKISGLKDMIFKDAKMDPKDFTFDLKVLLPKLGVESNYKLDGNILLVPINGEGFMKLDFENFKIIGTIKNRLIEKGDFTFFDPKSLTIDIGVEGFESEFSNLFNGNEKLEESTQAVFKEQWKDLFEALRPSISMLIHDFLLNIYKKTFAYIPANFVLLDIPKSTEINQ